MVFEIDKKWLIGLAALPMLAACGGAGDALGISKRPPDEFAVVSKAPLVMPPEYRLRPPDAANPRPEEADSQAMAIEALFPGRTDLPPLPSPGEQSLLRATGGLTADAEIRSTLGDDEDKVIDKGQLAIDLLRSDVVEEPSTPVERLSPALASR